MAIMEFVLAIGVASAIHVMLYMLNNGIENYKKEIYDTLSKHEDCIIRGHISYTNDNPTNKQVVYKVDGDFNGDIKGENVTIILMGAGDINGDIDIKNGEVFVHQGNINGNVKADKVLCPTPPNNKHVKHNPAKDVESPTLPTRFESSDPTRCGCESCTYYMPNGNKRHFWCTQGGMLHLCIKKYTTICKHYEDKNDY